MFLFAGKEYAITTTNLNLRESSSINSTSLKILNQGDTLEILSSDQNWTEVKVGNLKGYVSTNYVSIINDDQETNSGQELTSKQSSNRKWLLIVIISIIGIGIIWWLFSTRCSKCGKFGSLKRISSLLIDSKPTKVKEVLKRYNKKGEVTSKREVFVDATIKTYRNIYKCKNCGEESNSVSTRTVKN